MTAPAAGPVTPGIRAALRDADPTPEQWAAITAPLGPVHVVAGAGSGKTAVMAARIVYLVERLGVAPGGILGLTFTNRAAAELQERVRQALARHWTGHAGQVTIDTYHAFAAGLVEEGGVRVGVEPGADLLTEAQQYQLLLSILDAERFRHLIVRTAGATIRKTLELASACADHLVAPAAVAAASERLLAQADNGKRIPGWVADAARERIELARLVERYAAEKRLRGRVDFGDQVAKAVELVERHPGLVADLRARYPHVLLDEYQDTNVAQRRLIQQLCPPGASIMAVGDARQAIYGFRGATMYNLLSFAEHFPPSAQAAEPVQAPAPPGPARPGPARPEPLSLSLSTNFRSGRRILALANAVIEAIPSERRGGRPLVPLPANGDGEVRAALLADQFAEAAFVADQVACAHEEGLPGGTWPDWRDIAVLVRSKKLLGPLREALEQRGVPVEVVGLSGLLETPEIVDLVAMLRVIEDPAANVALARLLAGPRWRIGHRHLVRLARWASRHNWGLKEGLRGEDPDPGDVAFALAEALDHLEEVEGLDDDARRRLVAFRAELRELRAAADASLLDLVQTVLERTGVWAELEATDDRRAVSARQNLATFLDRVAAFAPVDGNPSLAAFLAYLDAVEDAAEPVEAVQPAPADSVKLMTVHMAKGLEFPMVVVAGLSAGTGKNGAARGGIFPDVRVADPRRAQGFPYELREDAVHLPRFDGDARAFQAALQERALEDERRLFYVAITRARQLLVLTAAWWYQGSDKTPKGPGPFWREAAAHPLVAVLVEAEQPPASPLTERLRARVRWPPPARRGDELADPLFSEGYAAAVELARADPAALAARVPSTEADAFTAALAAQRHLVEVTLVPPPVRTPQPPRILSVTQLLLYARCPRAFYWTVVRPLPAPPRPAARIGTVVHRLLERRTRTLPDLVDIGDLGADAPAPTAQPGLVERATRNFSATRFARLPNPEAEVGVVLRSGPWVVRGRIDAIFTTPDGIEVVDYKTGRPAEPPAGSPPAQPMPPAGSPPAPPMPPAGPAPAGVPPAGVLAGLDQLGLYALALRELGRLPDGGCLASYCYLGGDEPVVDTRRLTAADLDRQRALLDRVLERIGRGDYQRRCGQPDCPVCGSRM